MTEEVLARNAFVLLEVPMTYALDQRLKALKLGILLDARGSETDVDAIMMLAVVRTILGEDSAARSALRVVDQLTPTGPTPGSEALASLLDSLLEGPQVSLNADLR